MKLQQLEKQIGIKFSHPKLLEQVFIHKSFVNESRAKILEHNERLEFLGDAVLELVVTEFLYRNYVEPEGILTNWRSALVKGENLSKIATELNLGEYLFLSHGEEKSGGRQKNYILANTFEALIGAIYLDKDYQSAKTFIHKFVINYLEEIINYNLHIDAKSLFQERAQDLLGITPHYQLIEEKGPDHIKTFKMGAYLAEELIATGHGQSKQKAELEAAKAALKKKGWDKA